MATPPKPPKTPVKKPMAKRPAAVRSPKPTGEDRVTKPRPALTVVKSGGEVKVASGLRLKDLVDNIVETSGDKKQDVKKVVEAALIQMGLALKTGEGLNLAGLGRMRVAKAGDDGGAMTLKLRMATQGEKTGGEKGKKPRAEPLADGDDQD